MKRLTHFFILVIFLGFGITKLFEVCDKDMRTTSGFERLLADEITDKSEQITQDSIPNSTSEVQEL